MTWTPKDPGSVEHFALDFSLMLEDGDSVASISGVTIDSGDNLLVISAQQLASPLVTFVLSGGTLGTTYTVRAEVMTAGGERLELSANLLIRRPIY